VRVSVDFFSAPLPRPTPDWLTSSLPGWHTAGRAPGPSSGRGPG
jgi:hypothetical protein